MFDLTILRNRVKIRGIAQEDRMFYTILLLQHPNSQSEDSA